MPGRRERRSSWIARAALAAWLAAMTFRPAPSTATVAEQRARLPPAAECDDPIEGVWRGLSYYPLHGQWYEFTLDVRREAPASGTLTGSIRARFWDGPPERSEPAACRGDDHLDVAIRQDARGTYDGGKVYFGGIRWAVDTVACGRFGNRYITDQFKGVIDPERQEFQSINDWSERADDEATVFRRIRCADGPRAPADAAPAPAQAAERGAVTPPSYQPNRSGGC